jgi:hypothetical protein
MTLFIYSFSILFILGYVFRLVCDFLRATQILQECEFEFKLHKFVFEISVLRKNMQMWFFIPFFFELLSLKVFLITFVL